MACLKSAVNIHRYGHGKRKDNLWGCSSNSNSGKKKMGCIIKHNLCQNHHAKVKKYDTIRKTIERPSFWMVRQYSIIIRSWALVCRRQMDKFVHDQSIICTFPQYCYAISKLHHPYICAWFHLSENLMHFNLNIDFVYFRSFLNDVQAF